MDKATCAQCGKELSGKGTSDSCLDSIAHEMCEECVHSLISEMGTPLSEYLDTLKAPVIVVDSDNRVKTANKLAELFLGKQLPDIEGKLRGNVFECAYAKLPKGCGKTVHCNGCAMRRAIMDTLETGRSHDRESVILIRDQDSGKEQVNMIISTERKGRFVLMRIDEPDS